MAPFAARCRACLLCEYGGHLLIAVEELETALTALRTGERERERREREEEKGNT